jgi:hypothetical protein
MSILDATGEYPHTGEVLVQATHQQVTRGSSRFGPQARPETTIEAPARR